MHEKPKENKGFSRVGGGPGAQVWPTWAQKSHPREVRTAKMTLNRAAGEVRAVKVRPVRLDGLSELWNGMERAATGCNGLRRERKPRNLKGQTYVNDQTYD